MNQPYFCLQNVSYAYPDGTKAIQNITITIPQNAKIAVVGKNGSGKSTFFQLLMGLIKPTSGQLLFQNEKVQYSKKALKALRQQIGIVFQNADNQLFAGTVKQDIAIGPSNLGWSYEKVEETTAKAIALTQLEPLQYRPIHFLSGGQKKRVSIAGVYAMEPNLLLLDEPTGGLDNYFTTQMLGYLRQLENNERTFLLSTHDIQLAYEWADLFIVFDEGQIAYFGDAQGLFNNDDLLASAHLDKPLLFEIANLLLKKGYSLSQHEYPKTKNELITQFQKLNIL
ncbi:energy-coupling factor ABC transporter ATP-binding protein [Solibacillus sp. FSL H8-0538]|uniref:energy-coupling factor ABC transporter ATP-binding protein n=1 Tax=Solibacillus sp. FSL H8-0538 TaxID=2921400 RepID=UPI0030F5110F